jgi:hypothetical protein
MTAAQPPPSSAPIEPPRFRGRSFLRGCVGVVIALVIVSAIAIGSCVFWIRQPGELIETGSLLDADTALYAELHLRPDDPGILKFFNEMVEEQQRTQQEVARSEEMPPVLRTIFGSLPQRQADAKELEKILPVVVVATRQASEFTESSPFFFAVSLPKIGNRLRFADMFGSFMGKWLDPDLELQVEYYEDETIYVLDVEGRHFYLAVKGSDILVGQDQVQMHETIDRLSGPVERLSPSMEALLERRPEDAALFIAGRDSLAESAVDLISTVMPGFESAIKPLAEGSGGMVLWARIKTTDLVEGELRIIKGPGEIGEPRDDYEGTISQETEDGVVSLNLTQIEPASDERHAWKIEITGVTYAAREGVRRLDDRKRNRRRRNNDPNSE